MSSPFLTIGPSPIEEDCAPVGRPDYEERSRRECHVFLRQLERQFPPPDGASLFIKSFLHDFGAYREVCVRYARALEYAYGLENDIPMYWDDIARYELCWHEQYPGHKTGQGHFRFLCRFPSIHAFKVTGLDSMERDMQVLFLRFFAALFLVSSVWPVVADVLVVTDSRHPVKAAHEARIIELDAPARIEADLSSSLPSDPDRASQIARQRLGDRKLQQQLHEAYQGIADARSLGITRIPAVVVNQRYVVYGEADVARAVARVEQYRRAQP